MQESPKNIFICISSLTRMKVKFFLEMDFLSIIDFSLDKDFDCSHEFRDFVNCVVKKNPQERPTSVDLMIHPWILKHLDNLDNFSIDLLSLLEKI